MVIGIKKSAITVLLLFFALFFSGCTFQLPGLSGTTEESTVESELVEAGTVQLYHATDTAVVPDTGKYQLKQPDNLSASIEEIIEQLTIDQSMTIERFAVDENRNVTLNIAFASEISEEAWLLNQAAIVKSISGLDVSQVILATVDREGNVMDTATYTDASFYYTDY